MSGPIYCTYEDRKAEFPGVALLVASLCKTTRPERVLVFGANIPEWFRNFVRRYPEVELRDNEAFLSSGWSVKPEVLMRVLDCRPRYAIWLDADIVVALNISSLFSRVNESTFVCAEEPKWASLNNHPSRAKAWGLRSSREFSPSLNSCVVRVSEKHRGILQKWRSLMQSSEYKAAQDIEFSRRPIHLSGDQEVLHGILTSDQYSSVPVHVLESGIDIAQCHLPDGYSATARLRHVWKRTPPMVHAQGCKPWRSDSVRPLYHDLSTYLYIARRYSNDLTCDMKWVYPRSFLAWTIQLAMLNEPNLAGLPQAAWTGFTRSLRLRTRAKQFLN